MIPQITREEIANTPLYAPLLDKVVRFSHYLEIAQHSHIFLRQIRFTDLTEDDGNPIAENVDLGYLTRWSPRYRNHNLWRLYNFKGYFERYPDKIPRYSIMGTLTGKHDSPDIRNTRTKNGLGHIAWNEKLWYAKKKQRWMVQRYFPENYNISMWEAHPSSGFSHIHTLYFLDELPGDSVFRLIQNHWTGTLGMGSKDRAIEFRVKDVRDFSDITSLVGYPMAYIGKNTCNGIPDWTAADWVYNAAIYWSGKQKQVGGIGHCIRTFQPSFRTSQVMKRDWTPGWGEGPSRTEKTLFVDSRFKNQDLYDPVLLNKAHDYNNLLEYWNDLGGTLIYQ